MKYLRVLRDFIEIFRDFYHKYQFYSKQLDGYLAGYNLKKGDYVIDAGAYKGWFSFYAAQKVGKNGKVFSFEPILRYSEIIQKKVKQNGLKNLYVFNVALSDKEKTQKFLVYGVGSKVASKKGVWKDELIRVNSISVDNFIRKMKIPKIDFIKMDVEGEEIKVIRGMKKTIKKFRPNMAIASYHIISGKKSADLIKEVMQKKGYQLEDYCPEHLTTCCIPSKNSAESF